MESRVGLDFVKARPASDRLNDPLTQTALATANHYRKEGTPEILAADLGSTHANTAVAMGIPAVTLGAALEHQPHRLEEYAEASSIIPGIKSLVALAVSLTTH